VQIFNADTADHPLTGGTISTWSSYLAEAVDVTGRSASLAAGYRCDGVTGATSDYCFYETATTPNLLNGPLTALKLNVASARKGTFTCTAAGTITIANANEAATSDVIISLNTAGGTITTPPAMKTVTASTGFTVLCGATDTSVYNYSILN
jgi:hypothetical protein